MKKDRKIVVCFFETIIQRNLIIYKEHLHTKFYHRTTASKKWPAPKTIYGPDTKNRFFKK